MIHYKGRLVTRVYSGRADRCMCGCSGTYRVASACRAWCEEAHGRLFDDNEVNDTQVTRVVNRILKADPDVLHHGDHHVSFADGNRVYVAYFHTGRHTDVPIVSTKPAAVACDW